MKIVGIIAEYNPFHNGHQYHIDQALQKTGADVAVVLMSGDFVQRGAPAIAPKHLPGKSCPSWRCITHSGAPGPFFLWQCRVVCKRCRFYF